MDQHLISHTKNTVLFFANPLSETKRTENGAPRGRLCQSGQFIP